MSRFDTFKSLINRPILEAIRYTTSGGAVYEPNKQGRKSRAGYIMDAPDPDTRNALYKKNERGFAALFRKAPSEAMAGNFLFLEVLSALGLYWSPLNSTGKNKGEKSNLATVLSVQNKLSTLENRLSKCFSTNQVPFTNRHYSIIEHILINNKSRYDDELGFNTYDLLRSSDNSWDRIFNAKDKENKPIHGLRALLKNISDYVIAGFFRRNAAFRREKRKKEWQNLQRAAAYHDGGGAGGSRRSEDDWDLSAYGENPEHGENASDNGTGEKVNEKANSRGVKAADRRKAEKFALSPEDRKKVVEISIKAANLLYEDFNIYRDAGLKPYDVLSIWKMADSIAGMSMSLDNLLMKVDKEVSELSKEEQEDLTVDDYLAMIYTYLGKSLNKTAKNLSEAKRSALSFLNKNSNVIPQGFVEGIRDAISTHITEVGRQGDTARMINNLKRYIRQQIRKKAVKETEELKKFLEDLDTIANRGITKEDRQKLTDVDTGSRKAVENLNILKKIFDYCAGSKRKIGGITTGKLTLDNLVKLMKLSVAPPENCPSLILNLSKTITERFKDKFDLSIEDIESFANRGGSEEDKNYAFMNELYERTRVDNYNISNRYITNIRKGLDEDIEKAFSILQGTRRELTDADYASDRDDLDLYSQKPIVTILQDAGASKDVIDLYNGNPEQSSRYDERYTLPSRDKSQKTIGQLFTKYDINNLIESCGEDLKEAVYATLGFEIRRQKATYLNKLYVAIDSIEDGKDPNDLTKEEREEIERLEDQIEEVNKADIRKNLRVMNNIINAYEIATLAVGIGASPTLVSKYISNIASRIYATIDYLPDSVHKQVEQLYAAVKATSTTTETLDKDTRQHSGLKDAIRSRSKSLHKQIGKLEQSVFDPRVFIDLDDLSTKWKNSECFPGEYELPHGNGAVINIKDSIPVMGKKGKVSAVADALDITKADVQGKRDDLHRDENKLYEDDIIISYPNKTCGKIRAIFNNIAEFWREMNPKFRKYIPNPGANNLTEKEKDKLRDIGEKLKHYATQHIYEDVSRRIASLKKALSKASRDFLAGRGILSLNGEAFAKAIEDLYDNMSREEVNEITQTLATQSYDVAAEKIEKYSNNLVALGQDIAAYELDKVRSKADSLILNAKKAGKGERALIVFGKSVFVKSLAEAIDEHISPFLRNPGQKISRDKAAYETLTDFSGTDKMRKLMARNAGKLATAKNEAVDGNSDPFDTLLSKILSNKYLRGTCWGIQSHLSDLIDKICSNVQNQFAGISIIPEITTPTDVLRYNDVKVPIGFNMRFIITDFNEIEEAKIKNEFKTLFKAEDGFIGTEMEKIIEEPLKDVKINDAASEAEVSDRLEQIAQDIQEQKKQANEISPAAFLSKEMRNTYSAIRRRANEAVLKINDIEEKYKKGNITKEQYQEQTKVYITIIEECNVDIKAINAGNRPVYHNMDGKPLDTATLSPDEAEAIKKAEEKSAKAKQAEADKTETDKTETKTEAETEVEDEVYGSDQGETPTNTADKNTVNQLRSQTDNSDVFDNLDYWFGEDEAEGEDEESCDEVDEVLAIFSDSHYCPKGPRIITNRDKFKRGYMVDDRRKEDFYRRH